MQTHSTVHRVRIRELNVCKAVKGQKRTHKKYNLMPGCILWANIGRYKHVLCVNCMHGLHPPLGVTGEPVTQDGYSVDWSTAVEMDLQLICSSSIVYLGFGQCVRLGM